MFLLVELWSFIGVVGGCVQVGVPASSCSYGQCYSTYPVIYCQYKRMSDVRAYMSPCHFLLVDRVHALQWKLVDMKPGCTNI